LVLISTNRLLSDGGTPTRLHNGGNFLKVLFVSASQPDKHNAYNYRLMMLQQGIERLGAETDFLYVRDWVSPSIGGRIRKVPPILFPLRFSELLPMVKGYDAIHVGGATAAFPFCFFKKHLGACLIQDIHGDGISEMLMKWQLERGKLKNSFHLLQVFMLIQVAIHRADYHLVVSNALRDQLLAHHIPRERTLMLRNGADLQVFKPNGLPHGPFTVCYAGEFQVWQGLDNLIEAGRLLRDLDIRWKFVGFRQTRGDRAWREKIQGTLGAKAELVDRVDHEELIKHLQDADLLLSPRPYHSSSVAMFPCKFPEYIAMGRAVVVTDVGDTPRFVREHGCGLVCPPTAAGLAEAIRRAHGMGRERLQIMGQRARRLAETTFSWEVLSQRYYHFLMKIAPS
jgi:glycosyltransferase involved in cell wall biosynthesis